MQSARERDSNMGFYLSLFCISDMYAVHLQAGYRRENYHLLFYCFDSIRLKWVMQRRMGV